MKSTTSVVSQAVSIAQSTVSQVEVKLRTNQTKAKLRALLKNIDTEKSGEVKEDAFFQILALHGMELEQAEKNRLKKSHVRAGKIKYAEALQEVAIDLDSAVLNEEKWTLQSPGGQAQEAQKSLMPGKAVSHLSRMSLAEFNERQNEMQNEIRTMDVNAAYGLPAAAEPARQNDQVSKAGSSVSKPVQQSNMEQLHEFRSQLGLIQKTRPQGDNFDSISTTNATALINKRDSNAENFAQELKKSDRELYERLVDLLRFFSQLEIDMRELSQLKTCFIAKDKGSLSQVPIDIFKLATEGVFRHYREQDAITSKICDCVAVEAEINGIKQKVADSNKFNKMTEFMRCQPIKGHTDKNNSSGVNFVMQSDPNQRRDSEQPKQKLAILQPQKEDEYVKHLVTLVLTRMEDKHRNITEVFRFMDQRGKNKINKQDFQTAVERLKISLAREDVSKVWSYIDFKQQGFIQIAELQAAYNNRVNNFGKTIETAVEKRASEGYKQQTDNVPKKSSPTQNKPPTELFKINTGTRSPIITKSVDHTYGTKNAPSDEIGALVNNHWMNESAEVNRMQREVYAQHKNSIPKGPSHKQTLTSLKRREVNKQVKEEYENREDHYPTSKDKQTSSVSRDMKPATRVLPPLQRAPGSRRAFQRQTINSAQGERRVNSEINSQQNKSQMELGPLKPMNQERVLYPTQVKESFLNRNKHVAQAKMAQMAVDIAAFAKRSGVQTFK